MGRHRLITLYNKKKDVGMELKDKLAELVERFLNAKEAGKLDNASEETIRTWINELLSLFGWDVQDTRQVLQERTLDKSKREKLKGIGSSNVRPDYTFVNGNVPLAFLDAKSLDVNIGEAKDAAFQIRSYGWSIGATFSVVTNFRQLAVYECRTMPRIEDGPSIARVKLYSCEEFADNQDMLERFLNRSSIVKGQYDFIPRTEETLDKRFSKLLGNIRVDLAKSILDRNKAVSIEHISSYVQIIINRILFIRVCEAKGLEEDGLLNKFAETDFWNNFKESSYFNFYNHYDGPMFQRITELQALNIDNSIFKDLLAHLYYPSPYRFDVIPLKTLSDMYDMFLGYQLVVRDGVITNELRSEFKKSSGAVTTPEHIVHKVIESTLPEETINSLDVKDILELNIVDPACGSGVFLAGVYDYISDIVLKKALGRKGANPELFMFDEKGVPFLTISGKKRIINHCIYGVDINPEAVEVARMSLSLKILDGYTPELFEKAGFFGPKILEGVGENIKCGNSLVELDIISVIPSITNDLDEYEATNVFSWKEAYPNVFKKGGFDYIVGNPPYIEVKNYNVSLPSMARYIKKKYNSCKKDKIDLAIPFIEKGISLLNDKGRMGYIVQKRFFKTEYGEALRQEMSKNHQLLKIYDYRENDLFNGVITYVAIIVCGHNTSGHVEFRDSVGNSYNIPQMEIGSKPWNFDNPELWRMAERLARKHGSLQNICSVRVGIQVLWRDAYQIKVSCVKDGLIYGRTKLDNNVILEEAACRALLCNEKIEPFLQPGYTTYVIFPYTISSKSTVRRIPYSEFKSSYPKAGEYLDKHKETILANVQIQPDRVRGLDRDEYWHIYTRESHLDDEARKVCVPMTSKEPVATYLQDSAVYCDNANIFYLRFDNETKERMYAISAIINSTPFATMARMFANPQQNGYFKFSKQFLNPVPFPCAAFTENSPEMMELAEIGESINDIKARMSNAQKGNAERFRSLLQHKFNRIDEICCDLYGDRAEDRALLMSHNREDRL